MQFFNYLFQRHGSDKAQIQRARHRHVRARLEFPAPLVQVDLLPAELERQALPARGAEFLQLHAEHVGIKADAGVLVACGEDDMIDVIDHFLFSRRRGLYSRTTSPRWLMTLLAKRTSPRSPLA